MKKIILSLFVFISCLISSFAQTSFFVANDLGRNGYYEQKPIAEVMGSMASDYHIKFVVAPGDVHHFDGVESTSDPLWMTNFELIYSHPDLMLPWYPICGNHEYRGNTQAVVDYSKISRRWQMPSRYYAKTIATEDASTTCLLLFLDTTPLMDIYRNNSEVYPDANRQNCEEQLQWIEEQLKNNKSKWVIMFGHHPLYADTYKKPIEREQMQRVLKPLIDKYGVDFYICGHIHSFQHIRPSKSKTDYIVNSAGSLARDVRPIDGTRFCSNNAGFTAVKVSKNTIKIDFINSLGKTIYSYQKEK